MRMVQNVFSKMNIKVAVVALRLKKKQLERDMIDLYKIMSGMKEDLTFYCLFPFKR